MLFVSIEIFFVETILYYIFDVIVKVSIFSIVEISLIVVVKTNSLAVSFWASP